MNLVYEPKLYLVSKPSDQVGLYDFLNDFGSKWRSDAEAAGDILPEAAGRLCYMSFDHPRPGGNAAYIQHIKQVGHGSVLEHSNFGIVFTGVSRSFTHELVRHRVGTAFSQLSQRYVEHDGTFVVPPELAGEVRAAEVFLKYQGPTDYAHEVAKRVETADPDYWKAHGGPHWIGAAQEGMDWMTGVEEAHQKYLKKIEYVQARIERKLKVWPNTHPPHETHVFPYPRELRTKVRKAARGAARSLLPNATETKVMVTANARAWRHMIEKRCHPDADVEIRVVFHKVWQLLVNVAPNLFGDYQEVALPEDGTTALKTLYEGV